MEIIFHEIRKYIEQIKQALEQEGLETTKANTHMKLSWLWNSVQSSSKTILTEALVVNMRYATDLSVRIKVISTEFRAWHAYITNELQEEENDLAIW